MKKCIALVIPLLISVFVLAGGLQVHADAGDVISMSAGKTFYLKADGRVSFSSDNPSVANVSSSGLIYGAAAGRAKITVTDQSGRVLKVCEVNVSQAEPIKFAYISPNNAVLNSNVRLIAITDKNRDAVKFVVDGQEITATEKVSEGNTYVWTANFWAGVTGEKQVKAYSRKDGAWQTCADGETSLYVNMEEDDVPSIEKRRVSDAGVEFIAQCEGFSGTVYEDRIASGTPTIGYGKIVYAGDIFYNNLTQREAYAMLVKSLNHGSFASGVNNFLINNRVKFNQNQFDSFVSFSYNLGTGWMSSDEEVRDYILNSFEPGTSQRNLSYVNRDRFSYEMLRYHHAGSCVLGLLYRRMDEMNIFFYGDYTRHAYRNNPYGYRIPDCIRNQW